VTDARDIVAQLADIGIEAAMYRHCTAPEVATVTRAAIAEISRLRARIAFLEEQCQKMARAAKQV